MSSMKKFSANFLHIEIILASASPQRAALLKEYGFRFRIHPADIDETVKANSTPLQIAEDLGIRKVLAIVHLYPHNIILGADTLVVSSDGEVLGKPKNRREAEKMLVAKRNSSEQVITGYCLLSEHGCLSGAEVSVINYRDFSDETLQVILDSNEWQNVAGALRIEGKQMQQIIKSTTGDYHNIIGLPIGRIAELLRNFPI